MATTFNVYLKKKSDATFTKVKDGATSPYSFSNLELNTDYESGVAKVENGLESDKKIVDFKTLPPTVPDAPTGTVTAGNASGAFTITPPNDGGSAILEYFYRLKKTSDADWNDPVSVGTDLTGTINNLDNDSQYSIEFAARNSVGTSAWDDNKAVHFTPLIAVTGISLDHTTLSVAAGATSQLTATIAPDDASDKAVEWSSSDESKATVDENGLVTGVAAGTATITAKAHGNESKTATCAVTVTAAG